MMGGGMLGGPMMGGASHQRRPRGSQQQLMGSGPAGLMGMAGPMQMMSSIMSNMDQLPSGGGHTYSSSVMSMSTGPDGTPQVYRSQSSSRGLPGGVRETQRAVSDSASGTRRLTIGHHIGDRARILEKEVTREGEEEREELLNLDEEEAEQFE